MNRVSTFVHSFLAVGILVSGVSRVAAAPVTYSSLSLEVNSVAGVNDPNNFTTDAMNLAAIGSGAADQADHVTDLAAAAPVESQFLASLSSFGTETYDAGTSPAAGTNGTLAFVPTNITTIPLAPMVPNGFIFVEPVSPGTFSVSGSALLALAPAQFPGANTLLLSTPVTAFGTYIGDAGDSGFPDALSLVLTNSATGISEPAVQIGTPGSPDPADLDNIFYFGVTDANFPFDEVTLVGMTDNPQGDGILLDNTTVGFAAVPEPSSLVLVFGSLLTGLAFFVRRIGASRDGHPPCLRQLLM